MNTETKIKTRTQRKPFKSQIPFALALTALVVVFGFYLKDVKLVTFWIFGLAFGIILQRYSSVSGSDFNRQHFPYKRCFTRHFYRNNRIYSYQFRIRSFRRKIYRSGFCRTFIFINYCRRNYLRNRYGYGRRLCFWNSDEIR